MFQASKPNENKNNNNNNNNAGGRGYLSVDMNRNNSSNTSSQNQETIKKIEEFAKKIFPSYKLKSFTTFNVALIYFMYILCWIWYYTHDINWRCVTHLFGSHYGPDIGQEYEFHRLFTPLFLHQNNMHIFFNTLGLCFFGFELERYYGVAKYVIMYFVAAIGGNLLSVYVHYDTFALGASTSLFGVLALQCIYLVERKEQLGASFNRIVLQLTVILGINLVQSITDENIDGAAHLGGFIFGGLVGLLYLKQDWIVQRRYIKILIIIFMVIATVVLTYMVITHENGSERPASTYNENLTYKYTINGKKNVGYCDKAFDEMESKFKEEQENKKLPF